MKRKTHWHETGSTMAEAVATTMATLADQTSRQSCFFTLLPLAQPFALFAALSAQPGGYDALSWR
jgi:hypothetical protein